MSFENQKITAVCELVNTIDLEETILFGSKISIMLPKTFVDMPADVMMKKYPLQDRPQIVKSSEDGKANFALSYFDVPMQAQQVGEVGNAFQTLVARSYPDNVFYDQEEEPLGKTRIGWFDFKGYVQNRETYNLMFVTEIEQRVLLGVFDCDFSDVSEWKPLVHQMMLSIQDLKKKD